MAGKEQIKVQKPVKATKKSPLNLASPSGKKVYPW